MTCSAYRLPLAEVAVSIDLFGHPAALNPVASGSQLSVHEDKRDGWVIEREVLVLTRFRGPQRALEGRILGGAHRRRTRTLRPASGALRALKARYNGHILGAKVEMGNPG